MKLYKVKIKVLATSGLLDELLYTVVANSTAQAESLARTHAESGYTNCTFETSLIQLVEREVLVWGVTAKGGGA